MQKATLTLVLLALAAGPALADKPKIDYDREYDFASAKTVQWAAGDPAANELNQKRIVSSVTETLESKGLTFVPEGETADLYVVTHAASGTKQKQKARIGIGLGKSTSFGGISVGTSTGGGTRTVKVGTLSIELVDASTGDLVWRADMSETLSGDEDMDQVIGDAVAGAFRDFPPQDKKKKKN